MQREVREHHVEVIVLPQFLNTPGTEVAPRSDEVGEDLQGRPVSHRRLLSAPGYAWRAAKRPMIPVSDPGRQKEHLGWEDERR